MTLPAETRKYARQLRKRGWPLRRIASEVGAALSTVSLWTRDVPCPVPSVAAAEPITTATCPDEEARRRCCRCLRVLPIGSFNRDGAGWQSWCRDCFREYFRARGETHRTQVKAARARRRQRARAFIDEYRRSRCCADCGERDPLVLEFDHLKEKRGNIADLIQQGSSVRRLVHELHRCEVVCVNCHRLRTAARGRSWRLQPELLDSPSLTPGVRRNLVYVRDLLMGSVCADCGETRLAVLEFDHVGPKTNFVTVLARQGCSLRRLQQEISQCEIRCSNCHRRRTMQVPARKRFP